MPMDQTCTRIGGDTRVNAGVHQWCDGARYVSADRLPGGVFRKISFRGHRTGDIIQAALAGLGPLVMGFGGDREASYFYGQALSEVGMVAATDWDAA